MTARASALAVAADKVKAAENQRQTPYAMQKYLHLAAETLTLLPVVGEAIAPLFTTGIALAPLAEGSSHPLLKPAPIKQGRPRALPVRRIEQAAGVLAAELFICQVRGAV